MRTRLRIRVVANVIAILGLIATWALLIRQPIKNFDPWVGVSLTVILSLSLAANLFALFLTLDFERHHGLPEDPAES